MDTRRLLITIVIAGAAMLAFNILSRMWGGNQKPVVAPGDQLTYPDIPETPRGSEQGALPMEIRLGDPGKASKDSLALSVSNQTAGIDHAWLNVNDYAEHAKDRRHPTPEPLTLFESINGQAKPYSTLGVHVTLAGQNEELPLVTTKDTLDKLKASERARKISDDNRFAVLATQYVWKVAKQTRTEVSLLMTIANGGTPVVEITKTFRIDPDSYDIVISHEVRNLTDQPVKVAIDQITSLGLPADETQPGTQTYQAAGVDTAGKIIVPNRFTMAQTGLKAVEASGTQEIGKFSGSDPLLWVAASNRFFAALTRPTQVTGPVFTLFDGRTIPVVDHVGAANIDILQESTDITKIVAGIRLTGAAVEIAPRTTASFPLSVFLGPKKEKILQGDIHLPTTSWQYAHALLRYGALIQFSSGGCYSFCTFDWLAYLLLHTLDFLKSKIAFGNYGVAIVILVLLIRAALHPLTRMSQIKMAEMGKKMKDIQPLIEANKKKYAKDKQKQNEEMMRIYREKNVNPAGGVMGCLPMLLQMPIWVAMYSALRTDINLRHAVFVPGWINDLSAPDMTMAFAPIPIPLIGAHISALNLLPILLGIVSFVQMKVQLASQPKPADEQQASMQKMSSYMILILPIFLYNQPSGLNLYYFGSMAGGLVDTYFVRKTLKKKGILPATAQMLPTHEE